MYTNNDEITYYEIKCQVRRYLIQYICTKVLIYLKKKNTLITKQSASLPHLYYVNTR